MNVRLCLLMRMRFASTAGVRMNTETLLSLTQLPEWNVLIRGQGTNIIKGRYVSHKKLIWSTRIAPSDEANCDNVSLLSYKNTYKIFIPFSLRSLKY